MDLRLLFRMKYYFEDVVELFERSPPLRWRFSEMDGWRPSGNRNPYDSVTPIGTPSRLLLASVRVSFCSTGAVDDPFSPELFNMDDAATCSHEILFREGAF